MEVLKRLKEEQKRLSDTQRPGPYQNHPALWPAPHGRYALRANGRAARLGPRLHHPPNARSRLHHVDTILKLRAPQRLLTASKTHP